MAAVQLARRGIGVMLVGRPPQIGKGVAYSTDDPAHLLNIPAAKMSAWPDRPDDFVVAIADAGLGPEDYVPRLLFGHYLRAILDESSAQVIAGDAVSAEPVEGGWSVRLDDGRVVQASALVLAPGNQPPDALPFARDLPEQLFAGDPWGDAGRAAIATAVASGGDLLAVGTGLSMIDIAMSLDAAGHRGETGRGVAARTAAAGKFSAAQRGAVVGFGTDRVAGGTVALGAAADARGRLARRRRTRCGRARTNFGSR